MMNNRRITKPPGGEASDIFGASPTSTPPTTPRKKNYMASTIFTPGSQGQQIKSRNRPDDDSFKRLFGANGDEIDGQMTPRGKNHQKSNVLFSEASKANGHANGHLNGGSPTNGAVNGSPTTNGTNGTHVVTNGTTNGVTNGTNGTHVVTNGTNGTNGVTNGTNGTNGHSNGHYENGNGSISSGCSSGSATPNGSINGDANGHGTPTRRIPPGGYSSKLW